MKKDTFISELQVKQQVDSIFLVKYSAVQESRDGKTYLNAILADKTGDMECRKWQDAEKVIKFLERGSYIRAEGKVNSYQGRNQFIISRVTPLEETLLQEQLGENFKDHFLMKSNFDSESLFNQLNEIVDKLDEVYIADLLKSILNDPLINDRIKKWPAGKSIHHAYSGGLLEHIFSCTKLGFDLSEHYKVNQSYVVAGCILHDICKIFELSSSDLTDYTEEGKLIGHLVKVLEIIDYHASKIKNFPRSQKMHLKHIMLAHHGEYEYGSPKIPATREAMLVHLIDLMDSKMASFEEVRRSDKQKGHWSSFVKHLNRIVYKPEIPSFKTYQSDESGNINNENKENKTNKEKKDNKENKDKTTKQENLTHSLADKLKDFKP